MSPLTTMRPATLARHLTRALGPRPTVAATARLARDLAPALPHVGPPIICEGECSDVLAAIAGAVRLDYTARGWRIPAQTIRADVTGALVVPCGGCPITIDRGGSAAHGYVHLEALGPVDAGLRRVAEFLVMEAA